MVLIFNRFLLTLNKNIIKCQYLKSNAHSLIMRLLGIKFPNFTEILYPYISQFTHCFIP
jgi:hypothetical protein